MLHDPSASQLSKPIFITLTLKKLIRGIKLAKSLRKKVSRKKKLKFMPRRYFDFIFFERCTDLRCEVPERVSFCSCAEILLGFRFLLRFYSEKEVYYFED